ncbi:MAG: penicillin-binding protein 2 [Candidatus Margulisbacteria bacterium]|nr:penicillin-binding protein 2 [Candidatus Margulisiibacteriota bacterium]MBU1616907.1 penicillin-binding protein 2 [Candidatus Margulisiibacteriota bacterium]
MQLKTRLRLLFLFFLIGFAAVIVRLVDLQIVHYKFYLERSQNQRLRIIPISTNRGDILDARGDILATTVDSYSVFTSRKGFSWIVRKVTREEAARALAKNPKEYRMIREKKRIYPKERLCAQLLGFVGVDNQGLSGIEVSWDKYLQGKTGKVVTEGDPTGRELYGAVREIEPSGDGMSVTLTVDSAIQYVAERELSRQIKATGALSGMIIVMNAKNGEILALASKPDFNPNYYGKADSRLWHPRFLNPYEPGSTFKLVLAAAGLEQGVINLDTKLKALDQVEIGGRKITNAHHIDWQGSTVSISEMLEQSINTATVQVGIMLGAKKYHQVIRRFGFGEQIGFGLAGESRGIVMDWPKWPKAMIGMSTFGQGLAVTPLQLLQAVSAFANKGKMVKPHVVRKIEGSDGNFVKAFDERPDRRAVSEKTAGAVLSIMKNVVLRGTGKKAAMAYFSVGGKTGTAQKAAPGGRGYLKNSYITSFIGLAPLNDPAVITLVIFDAPQTSIWGETVAAPPFKTVTEYTLRYLNVRPDML